MKRVKLQFRKWLENFLVENFKTQREKFINQGYAPNIVDNYLQFFDKIRKANYKEIDNVDLPNVKNKKDIDSYQDFRDLETLVDYVRGQKDLEGKTFQDIKVSGKSIYEDNVLAIYYADSPQACVEYKGSIPYSWCIARKDSSNMFNTYRYQSHEPTFYFVKNKIKSAEEFKTPFSGKFRDPYHFFVLQKLKNNNYIVTSANNDGDKRFTWEQILQIEPNLKNHEDLFKHVPLSEEDREFYDRYKDGISDEVFAKLPYQEKSKYIDMFASQGLTLKQFKVLPEDLKNKYVNLGVGLDNEQFELIKNNKSLMNRYREITYRKAEEIIKNNQDISFTNSELDLIKENEELYLKLIQNSATIAFHYAEILNFENLPQEMINGISKSPEYSYYYAASLNFKNVPQEIINSISENHMNSYYYAKSLNFENVPQEIIDGIINYAESSYEYAKYLNFENVPQEIINSISENLNLSYEYAENLNFKNVPKEIIDSISKNPYSSYYYALNSDFKNVPKEIIDGISKNSVYSYEYAQALNFKNVPQEIIDSARKYKKID